jgi:glycosyltransferase involved in cell wall biosynthesis
VTRVSIIIPALNEEENLARVLPAVIAQIDANDEVIVVDNGSHDRTTAVAISFNSKVVGQSKRSRACARNAGLREANGEFIVFLDADCIPQPDWLKELLAPFKNSSIGAVAGEIINLDCGDPMDRYLNQKGHLTQAENFKHPFLPFGATANLAFRNIALAETGMFDEDLLDGEDADLCWRMQLKTSFGLFLAVSSIVSHQHHFSVMDLLRQKRRHAYAAAGLYKKYRRMWQNAVPTPRKVYWEYRSILSRSVKHGLALLAAQVRLGDNPLPDAGYQLLLELGEKLGRLQGSLRFHVWYP